jgi:hypothetical protein
VSCGGCPPEPSRSDAQPPPSPVVAAPIRIRSTYFSVEKISSRN